MTLAVPIQKLPHGIDLDLPFYATEQSAGMDLSAAIVADITLKPGHRHMVPTGIALALPAGFEAQIRSRSGLSAKNGVVVLNSPGTIDADYRGEIIVILHNHGDQDFTVTPGMRIAQMVIAPVTKVVWQEQSELSTTQRDDKGFGSTGL
ncbi:dUTP diphosphatase [Candidatus Finniella inopinata]|uniref:Deoxyuridine 5'-triphosphate nucleotidohydrolase n=1 Tax=Candidatus Finniella inopinata TaxID=1696036 RepID=A0A4Q7DH14_9PROT|nr:dUTP diphosphatase [Candidatus Finniella inopinata]RZI46073.1 dUTP diphosphatase [Candidatus Finniella inopinata]